MHSAVNLVPVIQVRYDMIRHTHMHSAVNLVPAIQVRYDMIRYGTVGDLKKRSDLVLRPNGLSESQISSKLPDQTEVQIRTRIRPDFKT